MPIPDTTGAFAIATDDAGSGGTLTVDADTNGASLPLALSICQTDIIIYGTDLADYIDREFADPGRPISPGWTPPPMVAFWSDFL